MAEVNLDAHWTRVFRQMAEAKADEQEGQAQKAQFLAWMDWLQEGAAGGLRMQHQFTRIKGGWVESAVAGGSEISSEETLVEDGLSVEQLRTSLHPAVLEQQPASIQEETEQQAENWHCEWGSSSHVCGSRSGRSTLAYFCPACLKIPWFKRPSPFQWERGWGGMGSIPRPLADCQRGYCPDSS